MYEWHSLDHVPLANSYASAAPTSRAEPFDYFHINSIDVEQDGDLLVDSRNTWAAYDVDPKTGQVRWELGGKRSSFKMGPGTATAWQHDARQQPDGAITFFDNGAFPQVHPQSRAIEVTLDPATMTATLVRSYEHQNPLVAGSQGNVQALAGGDWMVGWGQAGYLSEVNAAGQVLFNAHLPPDWESYRTFVLPWSGQPANPPAAAAVAAPGAHGGATVYASWNGATEVASWSVLAGSSPSDPEAGGQRAEDGLRDGDPAAGGGRRLLRGGAGARLRGRGDRHLAHGQDSAASAAPRRPPERRVRRQFPRLAGFAFGAAFAPGRGADRGVPGGREVVGEAARVRGDAGVGAAGARSSSSKARSYSARRPSSSGALRRRCCAAPAARCACCSRTARFPAPATAA